MRPVRFYAVGAIGMAVQLALFTLLVRVFAMHYQVATVLAVEAAVLHNFFWHRAWTWADRPSQGIADTIQRLARFNLTTGLVSVVGNLVFMQVFAGWLHLNAFLAVWLSLAPCAVLNFVASDHWVFRPGPPRSGNCVTL